MADINQVITLGIGTPSDIEHFILFGLNANPESEGAGVIRAWTLADRDTSFTLDERDVSWSLRDRDTSWAVEER
jgi:2,3-bisphosphoglycerate-independent phosphoglycerate mutase